MNVLSMRNLRGLILDMDGVLWKDNESIGDLRSIFLKIDSLGLSTVLATNNATRTVEQYQEKVQGFGIELEPWQFVNSAHATASYLQNTYPGGGPIFIIGSEALINTLKDAGYYYDEENVLAVVAGAWLVAGAAIASFPVVAPSAPCKALAKSISLAL